MKCVCGNPIKYIAQGDGCGDLRCITCLRSSGYCLSEHEAIKEFMRRHNHDPFKMDMDYKIGEAVGIAWEPHNRDFEICDIREIHYKVSGATVVEYQLARIGKPEYRSDWITSDKLFRLSV